MPGQMHMGMAVTEEPQALSMDQKELEQMAKKEYLGKEVVNGNECEKYQLTFKYPTFGTAIKWF